MLLFITRYIQYQNLICKNISQVKKLSYMVKDLKIGFIGGGNMATAIVEGFIRQNLVSYSQIYIGEPNIITLKYWKDLKTNAFKENGIVAEESDIIFLSVKPNRLTKAIDDIHKSSKNIEKISNKLFVSIIAGKTLQTLEGLVSGFKGSRLIRVFPNTPMMVGAGCSLFTPGKSATLDDVQIVHKLLTSSSMCTEIPESIINAAGSVTGSGPAFIFVVIEALSDALVKVGVSRIMATVFASQTVLGAAKMVLETGKHTGTLKDEVCSPGGTTITGIHALERGRLRSSLIDAVEAATKRADELGKQT